MSKKSEDVKVTPEDLERTFGKSKQTAQAREMEIIHKTLEQIEHVIVVCSGKGGVGKSTVAANLAISLAMQGASVGLLDVDITGPNLSKILGLEGQRPEILPGEKKFLPILGPFNIKVMSMAFLLESPDTPVIWRGPMKMAAIRQFIAEGEWGPLDYLVADLPPGTSDETLDLMQLTQGKIIVVTTPQDLSTLDARKTVMMAKTMEREVLGVIENMAGLIVKCPHCNERIEIALFGAGGGQKMAKDLEVPFLGSIPIETEIMQQGDSGYPFILQYPDSAATKAFTAIVKKIQEFVKQ